MKQKRTKRCSTVNDVAMASFKTQSRLLGLPVAGDSEDDDEEEEEVEEFNEAMVGRVRKRDVDSEDEEEEDSSSDDEEDDVDSSRESGAAADSQASDERARDRKRERAWLVANFIKVERRGGARRSTSRSCSLTKSSSPRRSFGSSRMGVGTRN